MIPPRVRDVRVHSADSKHRETGILAWIDASIDSIRISGITLRRTRQGRLVLRFPEHVGRGGVRFFTARPRGSHARVAIEQALLTAIEQQGHRL